MHMHLTVITTCQETEPNSVLTILARCMAFPLLLQRGTTFVTFCLLPWMPLIGANSLRVDPILGLFQNWIYS